MRCLLVGNYGVSNLGDDALREYFLRAYPEVSWTVVSASPKLSEVHRLPFGVRSFFTTNWLRTIGAIAKSDALVFGGGTLFTDIESPLACFLWGLHTFVARLFGKKVFLAFQGIGPFKTGAGEWIARKVVASAIFISVRDEASVVRLKDWLLHTKIVQTSDPVFLLLRSHKSFVSTQKLLTIIPRKNSDQFFLENLESLLSQMRPEAVRILSMQPDDPEEKNVVDKLKVKCGVSVEVRAVRAVDDLMAGLDGSSQVLTQRFHGALAALALGIPQMICGQGEGDKLTTLAREIGTDARGLSEEMERKAKDGENALRSAFTEFLTA